MSDFFRPFRRKMGVITLATACLFAAAWTRSQGHQEWFTIPIGTAYQLDIVSTRGAVSAGVSPYDRTTRFRWDYRKTDSPTSRIETVYWMMVFSDRPYDPADGNNAQRPQPNLRYWSVVIPLTLLSAALLLIRSKPKLR